MESNNQFNWNAYERDGRKNLEAINDNSPVEHVVAALNECCECLNHEDECYIPAIEQAIKRLKGASNGN